MEGSGWEAWDCGDNVCRMRQGGDTGWGVAERDLMVPHGEANGAGAVGDVRVVSGEPGVAEDAVHASEAEAGDQELLCRLDGAGIFQNEGAAFVDGTGVPPIGEGNVWVAGSGERVEARGSVRGEEVCERAAIQEESKWCTVRREDENEECGGGGVCSSGGAKGRRRGPGSFGGLGRHES